VAAAGRDLVEPAYVSVPDGFDERRTLGPEVGAIATLAGFAPDPEQQFLLDVSFALDKRGRPLIFDTTLVACRQNIKTGFLKQRALGKLYVAKRRLVVWSAHEFGTAQESAGELEGLIGQCDPLRSRVKLTNRGDVATHGTTPKIELVHKDRSRSRLIFKTRTSGGGRGLAGDDLFVDEAYAAQAAQVGAVMPIMLARPGAQVDFASSACRPESAFLWSQIERGRRGAGPRSFYIEWCAPPPERACDRGEECDHARGRDGCGCDKPEVIVLAHTAVTRGRIEMQTVLDLRRTMPAGEYAREVMGWHDEVLDDASEAPFTLEQWNELLLRDADAQLGLDADVPPAVKDTFGIEMDVDRAWTSITAAAPMDGPDDDRTYVEFVEKRRGRGWVVPRCVELAADRPGAVFAVDGGGPAAPLIEDLTDAGLEVIVLTAADVIEANSDFVDKVNDGGIVHGPQFEMDAAVEGARKRPLGERGFTVGRRASDDDPAPLLAGMFAAWAIGRGGGPNLW
jgi:hypothetical protein